MKELLQKRCNGFLGLCTIHKGAFPALHQDRETGSLVGIKQWFVTTKPNCICLEWLPPCRRLLVPRGVGWGHWELKAKRAGGPQHLSMCSVPCESVGIRIDVSSAGSKVQGVTCLSAGVFLTRVARFPSWLLKSQVWEPEGGKAAAAKPSPLCFHLRDIPLRAWDSSSATLLPEGFCNCTQALGQSIPMPSPSALQNIAPLTPVGCAGVAATPWMAAAWPVWVRVGGAQPGAAELGFLPRDEHLELLSTSTHLPWTSLPANLNQI